MAWMIYKHTILQCVDVSYHSWCWCCDQSSRDHGWSDRESKWEWESVRASEQVSKQASEWLIEWMPDWEVVAMQCNLQCLMQLFYIYVLAMRSFVSPFPIAFCSLLQVIRWDVVWSVIDEDQQMWINCVGTGGVWSAWKRATKWKRGYGFCMANVHNKSNKMRAMFISETEFQSTESNNNSFTYTRVFLFK